MKLSDLDAKGININVVIIQTPSTMLTMFIQDKIKRKYNIRNESIIDVQNKTDLKRVREVVGTTPPFSLKWYVNVDLDKVNDKDLVNAVKMSTTCVFVCTCSKYGTFKTFKEDLKAESGVYDFYINYLKRPDFLYLYDGFTLSDNKLTKQLFDYTVQSYSSDIESVFKLLIHLNQGEKFSSRKDIAEICGLGGNSIEFYIFSLLKPLSGSDKGLKTVIKNRVKAGVDLGESMSFSTMYNFMAKSLLTLIQLKQLLISGIIYKAVRKLPDSYDEKSLARYQKYIWRLKTIPMSELLLLRQCMGEKTWRSEIDMLNFIYNYYFIVSKRLLEIQQI